MADVYAPTATNAACPREKSPVKPVKMESPSTATMFIPPSMTIERM